jgi:hypothetical protein
MKKAFIFAAILLAVATTITIVSCKKDKQEEKVTKNVNLTENEQEENMDEYLLSLKQKMLSAQKGDETISLEQARHDLCDLLNFDFGDANYATDVFQNDTIYVKLALSNGMVDLSQLAITYKKALEQIMTSYKAMNLPEKSVNVIFCEYDDRGDKDGNNEEMRIVINYRGFTGGQSNMHDTLRWRPGRIDGCCSDPSIFHGGAITMQHWLRDAYPPFSCANGGRLYFTDEAYWYKSGYTTYDPTDDRFKIFAIFTYQLDTVCISHEDMEYYYTNILDYYHQETPNTGGPRAMNYWFVDCRNIPYSQPNVNGYPGDCWYWWIQIRYGKPNCTNSDPLL